MLAFENAVDIGHGRGRLAAEPAASVARIDAQLGRPADINEAWRSPAKADANYAAWVRYQNGGPWAPYALPAKDSVHCDGYAADSDDWYDAGAAQVWRDGGWRQTARYPGTARDEIWHGEYFRQLDKFYGQPAGGNATPFPHHEHTVTEEDMPGIRIHHQKFTNGNEAYVVETETGFLIPPDGHLAALVKAYEIDLKALPLVNEYDWVAVQHAKTYNNSGYPQAPAPAFSDAQIQTIAVAAATAASASTPGVDAAQIAAAVEERLRDEFAGIPGAVIDEQLDRLKS
jgi:hypothetical protein